MGQRFGIVMRKTKRLKTKPKYPEMIPGNQFARFDSLTRKLLAVPKSEVDKLEQARKKRSREK